MGGGEGDRLWAEGLRMYIHGPGAQLHGLSRNVYVDMGDEYHGGGVYWARMYVSYGI